MAAKLKTCVEQLFILPGESSLSSDGWVSDPLDVKSLPSPVRAVVSAAGDLLESMCCDLDDECFAWDASWVCECCDSSKGLLLYCLIDVRVDRVPGAIDAAHRVFRGRGLSNFFDEMRSRPDDGGLSVAVMCARSVADLLAAGKC